MKEGGVRGQETARGQLYGTGKYGGIERNIILTFIMYRRKQKPPKRRPGVIDVTAAHRESVTRYDKGNSSG